MKRRLTLQVLYKIADVAPADVLVCLSACQTGLGRSTADGVIGIGQAFFEAGVLAMVLSLWRTGRRRGSAAAGDAGDTRRVAYRPDSYERRRSWTTIWRTVRHSCGSATAGFACLYRTRPTSMPPD